MHLELLRSLNKLVHDSNAHSQYKLDQSYFIFKHNSESTARLQVCD